MGEFHTIMLSESSQSNVSESTQNKEYKLNGSIYIKLKKQTKLNYQVCNLK